ncbi:YciI family protein [Pengzhenrongella sp.]|jgi:uncharacterized protein YciI|uniref:YciI family protein n=1 Tax=Pengzhenrongella sp. TaxID=2888820 RepID=UPI002F95E0CF
MTFFAVTYVHPDAEGWAEHLTAHLEYLQELVLQGTVRASGGLVGTPTKSALLIMSAANREDLLAVIAKDPFQIHGLVSDMSVNEWDPIFGTYHDESSRAFPEFTQ